MMDWTTGVSIFALILSLYNAAYNWIRNHIKQVDFLAEIIYSNKEGDGADRPDEKGIFKKGLALR